MTDSVITSGDFATLRTLEDHWSEQGHDLLPLLRRKLASARIVFQGDLPRRVATIGSRIAYTIDRGELETRTLTSLAGPDGQWLPVQLALGLAILGRSEGETFEVSGQEVRLHRVFDQPGAETPRQFQNSSSPPTKTPLRLVHGSGRRSVNLAAAPDQDDDPGPSAA